MALTDSPVRVLEVCKIIPPPESATESSLPLTFFDTSVFNFCLVEFLFSYELISDSSSFFSSILPRLKQSLSLTLLHFLPFFGNLVWPSHSDKPFILYTPGDGVSLTVAESDADFHSLSGDSIREAPDSYNYVPGLNATETEAETMSFQITFFPNEGFCIGTCSHHAVFDGKSVTLFLKAWAHICKHLEKENGNPTLPPELTPFLDRTVIQDSQGLDVLFLNNWISIVSSSGQHTNLRSLKLFPKHVSITDTNLVRGTFHLSREDIQKIRQKKFFHQRGQRIYKEDRQQINMKDFSNFVITYTYVATAIIKAKGLERNKKLILGFACDVRGRLDPPVPANYFGNCIITAYLRTEVEFVIKEEGFAFVAEELTKSKKSLEKGAQYGLKEKFEDLFMGTDLASTEIIGVASSPQFRVYSMDFGWGKPKKVEVTSIDKDTSMSMAESKDGSGGIELGVVLKKHEMEMFHSLFLDGLG